MSESGPAVQLTPFANTATNLPSTTTTDSLTAGADISAHVISPLAAATGTVPVAISAAVSTPTTTQSREWFSDRRKSSKTEKITADFLGMQKFPPPKDTWIIFGTRTTFSYSYTHLCLLAFQFGFTNVISYDQFGIFTSMMTGNMITMVVDVHYHRWSKALFKLSTICAHELGCAIMCFVALKTKDRAISFAIVFTFVVIAGIVFDLFAASDALALSHYHEHPDPYRGMLLTTAMGALSQWTFKLGYLIPLQTGNMHKTTEALFKVFTNFSQGSAKLRGDAIIFPSLVIFFAFGAFSASWSIGSKAGAFLPITATWPLQMYCAGCFEKWGCVKEKNGVVDMLFPIAQTVRQTAAVTAHKVKNRINSVVSSRSTSVTSVSGTGAALGGSCPSSDLEQSGVHESNNNLNRDEGESTTAGTGAGAATGEDGQFEPVEYRRSSIFGSMFMRAPLEEEGLQDFYRTQQGYERYNYT